MESSLKKTRQTILTAWKQIRNIKAELSSNELGNQFRNIDAKQFWQGASGIEPKVESDAVANHPVASSAGVDVPGTPSFQNFVCSWSK